MKHIYILVVFSFFLFSCKKETTQVSTTDFLQNVKASLKGSLTNLDYASLDFSGAVLNHVDSVQLYFVRIPFKGKKLINDFVIVKTNRNGNAKEGKIIHLEGNEVQVGEGIVKRKTFDGHVSISSLNRNKVLNSEIRHGYILALHPEMNSREQSLTVYPVPDLPEVVIVAYVNNYTDTDFSTWFLLNGFFYSSFEEGSGGDGGGNSGDYYGSSGGGYSYGGGGSGSGDYTGGSGVAEDQTISIDVDTYADKDPINLEDYLKCFDQIPDAGAQCKITIYADIPVDSDPNKLMDFSTGSPGHTFIGILKTNGVQSAHQYIGFYPKTGWKSVVTNAPIAAKFVDDSQHEFNASFSKTLTSDQLKSVLTEIRYLKNAQYDIDNFNCTDWALSVFNREGYGLDIPLYDIPGNVPSVGTSMPQGVYNKLKEMKDANAPHADQIEIGFMKGFARNSTGPCY